MKKIFSMFITIQLLFSLFGFSVLGAETVITGKETYSGKDYNWTLNLETNTLTFHGEGHFYLPNTKIYISEKIDNLYVNVFDKYVDKIKKISIEGYDDIATIDLIDYKYLEEIILGSSVEAISAFKSSAFKGEFGSTFKKFTVDPANASYKSVDGVLYDKDMNLIMYPVGKTDEKWIAPENIADCKASIYSDFLKEVIIPENVGRCELGIGGNQLQNVYVYSKEACCVGNGYDNNNEVITYMYKDSNALKYATSIICQLKKQVEINIKLMDGELDTKGTYHDNINWIYKKETKTLIISGEGKIPGVANHTNENGEIPYWYLKSEVPYWYLYMGSIDTLVIKNGITVPGFNTLYFVPDPKNIYLPKSLESFGYWSFSGEWGASDFCENVYYEGSESEYKKIEEFDPFWNLQVHYNTSYIKDFSNVKFLNKEYTYDGTEKSISVTGTLPTGANIEYTNEKATNAGTYNATAKITCEGYNDLTLNATLKINPKNLTVSGLTAQNKKYDGTDTANLSGGSLNGKISGDDVNADIPVTGKFANANAGNNIAVSVDNITLTGTKKDNYTLTQPTGLKANIEKAEITVSANDKQMVKGGAIPKLDYATIGELYGNDKITGELKVNTDGKTVGDFDITQGTLAVSLNYKLTFEKGKLSVVDKTPQNITVSEIGEKTYGDEAFKISATADENANLSNFSYESDNKDIAEVTADGTITIKAAGEANIKVKEPGNDDYAAFEKTIKLVVKKKGVEIKSINIDDKTAALDGVLTEDTDKVTVDFEKVTVEITGEADETSSNVILKNFALKGKKAANYEIITNAFESVIANDKIVNVSVKGENCVLTGGAKYLKGTSVTVTAAPESRYRFRGWYIGDTQVSDKAEYTFTAEEDIELTAKCTRKRSSSSSGSTGGSISGGSSSYTINFATNGGSEMKSIGVKANQAIGEIAEPTKEGYVFTGWYSDKELTKPFGKEDRITASVTLYAGWKIDPVRQLILTIGEKSAKAFGKDVENDVAPIIRNDRTMLPARFVAENLGAKVLWDEDKQLVTVSGKNEKDEDVTILITIGADAAIVNGEEIKLDSPAFIENDRTYTPVRFIAEQLGTSVEWNEEAKTVTITK